jgi:carbamoyl-phosphate synthase large subunit
MVVGLTCLMSKRLNLFGKGVEGMSTVLITGAGGAAIPGIIQHLRGRDGYDHHVLVADADPNVVGLRLADKSFVIPKGGDPAFLPALRRICLTEHVDVVVPLVDEELVSALELESDGIKVLLPRRAFVQTCLDKFYLMQELMLSGIQIPTTWLGSGYLENVPFPAIVKPRVGRGSRGIGIVDSLSELEYFIECSSYVPDALVVQPCIEGTEYTVSVVVWRDGQVQAVVPKEIISKKGVTHMAVTRRNERIDVLCRNIQECLHADGPFNVQLVVEKESGIPIPFEINPRFSSTTTLTTAAGVDEIGGLIQQALDPNAPRLTNKWREDVVLLRHTVDIFETESTFHFHSHSHSIQDATC